MENSNNKKTLNCLQWQSGTLLSYMKLQDHLSKHYEEKTEEFYDLSNELN